MTYRNVARADFDQVAALFLACDLADVGEPDSTVEDLAEEWERPGFEVERDAWVAVTPSGHIAGYGEIWERYAGEPWAFGCVHGRAAPDACLACGDRAAPVRPRAPRPACACRHGRGLRRGVRLRARGARSLARPPRRIGKPRPGRLGDRLGRRGDRGLLRRPTLRRWRLDPGARREASVARARPRAGASSRLVRRVSPARPDAGRARRRLRQLDRGDAALRAGRNARALPLRSLREDSAKLSTCPGCARSARTAGP